MSGTTDFLYNTATNLSTLYTATTDGIAQIQTQPAIQDTMSSGDVAPIPPLVVNAANPKLPVPGPNSPGGVDQAQMILTSFPEMVLSFMDALPTPSGEDKFAEDVQTMLGEMGEDKLSAFGGGNPQLGLARLKFAILHPGANFPKEIKDVANQIRDKASESAGYSANEFFVAIEDGITTVLYKAAFDEKVVPAGLTESELKQVMFAADFPETAPLLPPKLQKLLKEAEASALELIKTDGGLPSDYPIPRNTAAMKQMLSEKLGEGVDNQLAGLLSNHTISRSEYNEMRTMLAMPGASTPHAEKLKPILQKLIETTMGELKTDYGMPDDFPVSPDGTNFQALLNGTYFGEFKKQLENPSLNLTPDQKAQLKEALISEAVAEALPPELKTILTNLKAATLAKVSVTYGLPDDWQPDTAALSAAATRTQTPAFKAAQEGLNQGIEAYGTAKKIAKDLDAASALQGAAGAGGGGNPIAFLLKDYLKALSMVLITMQEMLSQQSVSNASMTHLMSIVQRDAKLGELEKRTKEMNEIIAKQKKMAALGPLKVLFQWIINIILIMFAGPVGILLLINSIAQAKKNGTDPAKMNLLGDLGKTCQDIGKSIGGPLGKTFADLAQVMTTLIIAILCPMALMADLLIGEATFVKQFLMGCGMSKKDAGMAAMAIQMVVMVIVMVLMIFFSGGASLAAGMAKIGEMCGKVALYVLEKMASAINWLATYMPRALEFIKAGIKALKPGGSYIAPGPVKAAETPKVLKDAISSVKAWLEKASTKTALLGPEGMKNLSDLQTNAKVAADNLNHLHRSGVKGPQLEKARSVAQVAEAASMEGTALMNDAMAFSTRVVWYVTNVPMITLTVIQTVCTTAKQAIQIQVERIKAELESNRILVDAFVALIKALIAKLLEMLRSLAGEIKDTVSAHKKLFESMSQIVQSLFA